MSVYEIGLLGDVTNEEQGTLTATLGGLVAEFNLSIGGDVMLRVHDALKERDRHAACAVAYFGGAEQADQSLAREALASSLPVIPTIPAERDFVSLVPTFLHAANGLRRRRDDYDMRELAIALLECVGLLRRQRRVFVSYRRVESRNAAIQLHDLLSGRGFDVFLDTHDIRPGEPFQEVLWHRLCDSDVMVMLDTPTYFENKWTRQELGRARAKEIHVLRIVWPDHTPSRHTDFAETIFLDRADLRGRDGPIVDAVVDQIALAIESLRSRSIASRYMSITGKLRSEVERIGGAVDGVGAHRAIALRLPDGSRLWAYPVVGIPAAEMLNDVADKARRAEQRGMPVLVYDHIGIRDQWIAHLKWLDDNIKTVRAIKVAEAAWSLVALEGQA
jgi:hypothetical protein